MPETKTPPPTQETRTGAAPQVKWDDSDMKTSYANVCNVGSTREEVTLLFGTHQAWNTQQKEVNVKLSDRVILSPYAAKRLAILIGNVVSEYEKRFGALEVQATPTGGGSGGGVHQK